MSDKKKKLMFVVSSPFALNSFLKPHITFLKDDFDIHICVNESLYEIDPDIKNIAQIYDIPIQRKISPLKDLNGLWKLFLVFLKVRPMLVQSITPKAGLLAMAAGWLCRIPNRWHTFTGQYWENKTGIYRHFLKNADRAVALFATKLAADSPSQARFLKSENVTIGKEITVIGDGSIAGVDIKRFKPDDEFRKNFRKQHQVPDDHIIFLFVGRLAQEKGVFDLLAAFKKTLLTSQQNSDPELWFVGPDDENIMPDLMSSGSEISNSIKYFGATYHPEHYMMAADVICLPSYREGFGSIIIEAAACCLPSIGYKINGLVDSVDNGSTGLLVQYQDIDILAEAMTDLLKDKKNRLLLGENAYKHAVEKFSQDKITNLYRKSVLQALDLNDT